MGITSGDIERVTFSPARHGYDTDEVDGYLQQVAAEVDGLNDDELAASRAEAAELKRQLAAGGDAGEPTSADEDDGLF